MSIRVFYNKSCKICRAEINHYKNICKKNVIWTNIVDNKEAQRTLSKSYQQLIRRIHVIKGDKVISGAAAFLEIWRNIPKYKFLYYIFRFKFFYFFLLIFYEIAALILFLKNKNLLDDNKKK